MTISPMTLAQGMQYLTGFWGKEFLKENYLAYVIFKFEFTDEEMQTIKEMDTEHGNFYLRG